MHEPTFEEELQKLLEKYENSKSTYTLIHNHQFEKIIKDLLLLVTGLNSSISQMGENNDRLRDEHFKDNTIQKLSAEVEKLRSDIQRGFNITEEEEEAIREWKKKHIKEKHPNAINNPAYFGAIGGEYTYEFKPTSIGVVGKIKCCCGDEFVFQKL